ncbi:carboxypeptidase regulatory-like domain-containing protein [Halomonas sp. TRM85114]|uniref:carboxypeptidase-like regulatory domain-containing protein n=1 Tax=Halomonas jincaotanensis TaxID=2810616 RepID=UPI001BD4C0D1|nr:carboxypeptidase-like regulatory domain-containing protein [Halomonas jincaotanensis]MBS9404174.1 carboxypeptidase regulatory-like domain-containing protein [Halomonas jincaotanensis]
MPRWILPLLIVLLLAGCQVIEPRYPDRERERIEVIDKSDDLPGVDEREPSPPPTASRRVPRQVDFPAQEYAALEKSGSGVISGRLTLSGRPIPDRPISVAPVTTYSAEAAEQALAGRAVEPADPRARDYTHTSRTDGNGRFRVSGLPAGEFYVSSSGRDPASGETRVIIHQISLDNGQQRNVDLSR